MVVGNLRNYSVAIKLWEKGRQGTGYLKMKIASGKTWDCYLLKYPKGTMIGEHLDPVPGREHHRINFTFKRANGGWFFKVINGECVRFTQRYIKFRPDIETHGVTQVRSGTRYVLSIGWVK